MKCIISGHYPAITCEEVNEADSKFEFVMLALRTTQGLSLKAYQKQFGNPIAKDFPVALKKSVQYLQLDGDNIRIKDEYLYVQNSILMAFMEEETLFGSQG